MKRVRVLLLLLTSVIVLTACKSVDDFRNTTVNTTKRVLQAQSDTEVAIVPNGDRKLEFGDKTVTVKKSTFDTVKSIIKSNNEVKQGLVDIIGDQITDENIATIAYYADKFHLNPKDLIDWLTK